jgi:hypothetical protein
LAPWAHELIPNFKIQLNIQFSFQVQAFNLAGVSPLSKISRQSTLNLPPVTSSETLDENEVELLNTAQVDLASSETTKEEEDKQVLKYLLLGGCLAGSLIVFMLICSVVTYCHRYVSIAMLSTLSTERAR